LLIALQKFLPKGHISTTTLNSALDSLERDKSYHVNPLAQWLLDLKWDGEYRLSTFFENYCNCIMEREYLKAVGENFFTALVARAIAPGCKMDHMLILEGRQGIGKSRLLRCLGGKYYRENKSGEVTSKDFLQALHGCWIYDVNELRGFTGVDHRSVKSILSSQEDTVRLPYRRDAGTYQRTCVIVGTTNDDLYLSDHTGHRRFWPVVCGYRVEVELVEKVRDQLFAEAVARYQDVGDWWTMPAGLQEEVAASRAYISPYFERVATFIGKGEWLPRYVEAMRGDQVPNVFAYVTMPMVLRHLGLKDDMHQRSRAWRELSRCLRALNYERALVSRLALYNDVGENCYLRTTVWQRNLGPVTGNNIFPEPKTTAALTVIPRVA
jgi:hypothetical protein